MSKKADKRARRRQQQASLPDLRRAHLMALERRGQVQTTPRQWQQRDPQPWYLPELGLTRNPFMTTPARGELPPIIRTRKPVPLELATVG